MNNWLVVVVVPVAAALGAAPADPAVNPLAKDPWRCLTKAEVSFGRRDKAVDSGGAMLRVRKGKRMIHFMYATRACTTLKIVPLARKVVDQL